METEPQHAEKPIYSGEVDGLTKAANEVSTVRELGNTESLADEPRRRPMKHRLNK
jgi:hypothetical protein